MNLLDPGFRYLFIIAPDRKDDLFIWQQKEIEAMTESLLQRNTLIYYVFRKQIEGLLDNRVNVPDPIMLRKQLKARKKEFSVRLIDINGVEKLKSEKPVHIPSILSIIDILPSRKAELQKLDSNLN